jgi:hypothetical protein
MFLESRGPQWSAATTEISVDLSTQVLRSSYMLQYQGAKDLAVSTLFIFLPLVISASFCSSGISGPVGPRQAIGTVTLVAAILPLPSSPLS